MENELEKAKEFIISENYIEVDEIATRIIKFEPNNTKAIIVLAESKYKQTIFGIYDELIKKVNKINPNEPNLYFLQSKVAFEKGKLDIASFITIFSNFIWYEKVKFYFYFLSASQATALFFIVFTYANLNYIYLPLVKFYAIIHIFYA